MSDPLPWEADPGPPPQQPGLSVDLRRCIGCHACSIACKTAHELPLGEFRMRVRWLPRPDRPQLAFLPLYAESCDLGSDERLGGRAPECVRACPTAALVFGDRTDPKGALRAYEQREQAKPFGGQAATHPGVRYVGLEAWMAGAVGRGVPLDPSDPDIVYEQGGRP